LLANGNKFVAGLIPSLFIFAYSRNESLTSAKAFINRMDESESFSGISFLLPLRRLCETAGYRILLTGCNRGIQAIIYQYKNTK
jgi:hypothetical protein